MRGPEKVPTRIWIPIWNDESIAYSPMRRFSRVSVADGVVRDQTA